MENQNGVTPLEIANLLRRIIQGTSHFKWEPSFIWAGEKTTGVRLNCEGYIIDIFVDIGELDYVSWVIDLNGNRVLFDEKGLQDPLDLLTDVEHELLIKRFIEKSK